MVQRATGNGVGGSIGRGTCSSHPNGFASRNASPGLRWQPAQQGRHCPRTGRAAPSACTQFTHLAGVAGSSTSAAPPRSRSAPPPAATAPGLRRPLKLPPLPPPRPGERLSRDSDRAAVSASVDPSGRYSRMIACTSAWEAEGLQQVNKMWVSQLCWHENPTPARRRAPQPAWPGQVGRASFVVVGSLLGWGQLAAQLLAVQVSKRDAW